MPFMQSDTYEPCICADGPLMGKEDAIACLCSNAPVDSKYFTNGKDWNDSEREIYIYDVRVNVSKDGTRSREKDSDGRWVLRYRKDVKEGLVGE